MRPLPEWDAAYPRSNLPLPGPMGRANSRLRPGPLPADRVALGTLAILPYLSPLLMLPTELGAGENPGGEHGFPSSSQGACGHFLGDFGLGQKGHARRELPDPTDTMTKQGRIPGNVFGVPIPNFRTTANPARPEKLLPPEPVQSFARLLP
eukprot:10777694-Heterocapsa_arctica.AAC.1